MLLKGNVTIPLFEDRYSNLVEMNNLLKRSGKSFYELIKDLKSLVNNNSIALAGMSALGRLDENEKYDFIIADEVHKYLNDEKYYNILLKFSKITKNILMLSAMLLFFKLNIVTIIIWTLLNAFFQVYVTNPTLSIFYALTNRDKENNALKPELFVVKSFFSALGRCWGILLLFSILSCNKRYPIILLAVTGMQYLTLYFCSRAEAAMKREGR